MKGRGDASFEPVLSKDSGFATKGQVSDITTVNVGGERLILVAKNNEQMQVFGWE